MKPRRRTLWRALGIGALLGVVALGWRLDRAPPMIFTYATGWSLCGAPGGFWPRHAK